MSIPPIHSELLDVLLVFVDLVAHRGVLRRGKDVVVHKFILRPRLRPPNQGGHRPTELHASSTVEVLSSELKLIRKEDVLSQGVAVEGGVTILLHDYPTGQECGRHIEIWLDHEMLGVLIREELLWGKIV